MSRLHTIAFAAFFVTFTTCFDALNAADLSKRPDDWFGSDEGRKTMDCILSWQSEHGDWPKNKDTTTKPYTGDRSKLTGTFDNGATTGELRALARAFHAPAMARSYELVSLSGSESAGILKYLMSLEKPTPEVIRAVNAGVAWFDTAKIKGTRIEKINGDRQVIKDDSASPVWARFYEIETTRPFFCDRDGVPKYSLAEIGSERRNGYAWYGNWGESLAGAYAKWPHRSVRPTP